MTCALASATGARASARSWPVPDSAACVTRAPVAINPRNSATLASPYSVASSIRLVTPVTGAGASTAPSARDSRVRLCVKLPPTAQPKPARIGRHNRVSLVSIAVALRCTNSRGSPSTMVAS
ncbi:hypothetical protein [Sphingomonas aerolata]|uniref:hypothetical protein n=1 Tax=Sphingomonas aerolata TaxID=185951 RepID=UPI002FE14927